MENTIKESSLLPEHYMPVPEPNYKGAGEHSIHQLENFCELYKELVHQLRIREQSILLASGFTIVK